MRASKAYSEYLRHFGRTFTIRELHRDPGLEGIGLRHDVDYDVEAAVALGRAEADAGCRSTFYLLHSATYWGAPAFAEACQCLIGLGHEVGLHLNVLAEWYEGRIDSLAERLGQVLSDLRSLGFEVTGCAAHGDPSCYRGQFANHWMLEELRGANPALTETGVSAEGIRDERPRFQLRYPETHRLTRAGGDEVPLWSLAMGNFGLEYHAVHVRHSHYFSDSGGSWKRTPDPRSVSYQGGRWQVLMHPEYWLAPPRVIVNFGSLDQDQLEEGKTRGVVPVSADLVANALGRQILGKRRVIRQALGRVQQALPKRGDAVVYGMPESMRSLWAADDSTQFGVVGKGWIPRESICLETREDSWEGRDRDGWPGKLRGEVRGAGVAVTREPEFLRIDFTAMASQQRKRGTVLLREGGGMLQGRGHWRIWLDVDTIDFGVSVYVADDSARGRWIGACHALLGKTGPLSRVTGLPAGRSRLVFCYSQLHAGERFVLAIRAAHQYCGAVRVFGLQARQVSDCFFAAEPAVESMRAI